MPEDLTPAAAPAGDAAADLPATPLSPPGYGLREEVGRGGMGVVYRARDVALDRDVAVKLLAERYSADSPAAQRFLGEARITCQLQHPGIPAVHQVGALADGRPFLAMKLIKGSTLEALLKQRTDPAADHGRLLAVFEAVCQAVGYAHAHRVIHRDLKPANVMVGAFGEVQVMDWGLAKDLMRREGLDRRGADAELVGLCRRCLSPGPANRPAGGQAVADGLTTYLNGVQQKLRKAELAEAEARAKAAAAAKRRRLTLALAATVLLAGGGGLWYQQQVSL